MKYIVAVLFALLFGSCGETPLEPPKSVTAVDMIATISPTLADSIHPAIVSAEVINYGSTAFYRMDRCGDQGIGIQFFDAEHQVLRVHDPRLHPACYTLGLKFSPGDKAGRSDEFYGVIYDSLGQPHNAPSGTYTVEFTFPLPRSPQGTADTVVERVVTFQWSSR